MSTEKPYLSPSQLDTYCRCPEAWRRRYVEGDKIPPGVAALRGTGVHVGAQVNFRQKIDSHVDLPAQEIVDAAVAGFEAGLAAGYLLTPEEESVGAAKVLGEAKDEAASLAGLLATSVSPDYQPVMVEERVRIVLPTSTHDLLGIIDLADDQGRVIDLKTGGKAKTQDDADGSVQLTLYAAAYHVARGEPATELRLESLVTGKVPKRVTVTTERDVGDYRALAARTNSVIAGIEHGVFTPAPPGAWWCSAKWCGYHSTCPFVNGARKPRAKPAPTTEAPDAPAAPRRTRAKKDAATDPVTTTVPTTN